MKEETRQKSLTTQTKNHKHGKQDNDNININKSIFKHSNMENEQLNEEDSNQAIEE